MKRKETEHPKQVQGDIQKPTNQDTFYSFWLMVLKKVHHISKFYITNNLMFFINCIMNVLFFKIVQWTDKIIII